MPQEPVVLGYQAQVDLNEIHFGVTGGNMEIVWDEHEVGDSETGRAKTHKRGRYVMQGTLNFLGKDDIDYHADPLFLATDEDEEVEVTIWHNGRDAGLFYQASFCLFNFRFEWDKSGELRGTLSGKSNGEITRPGDA